MSPRTGRPKVENPKNNNVKVRFDNESYNELIEYCEKNDISKTDAIRKGVKLLLAEKK